MANMAPMLTEAAPATLLRAASIAGIASRRRATPKKVPMRGTARIQNCTVVGADEDRPPFPRDYCNRGYRDSILRTMTFIPPHTKRAVEGFIPAEVFVPPETKPAKVGWWYGSQDATTHYWNLAQSYLGLTRQRLWVVLGGNPTGSYRAGRTRRLSQVMTMRIGYLFYLKGSFSVNTSALYAINWETGTMYFNAGQESQVQQDPGRELVRHENHQLTSVS